jgi:ATP-binding cassette, subfamily B, bacterial
LLATAAILDAPRSMRSTGKSSHRRLRWVLPFVRPNVATLGIILILSLAAAAASSIEPLILKSVFDELGGGAPEVVVRGVLFLGALILLREVVEFATNWLTWRTRLRLHFSLLDACVDRLHRLPISYHQERGVGSTMTRLDRGIQGFLSAFNQIAFQSLPALVYLALSVVFMVRLDARLAVVVLLLSPLPAVIAGFAGPRQARRERRLLDRWSAIYARFNEVLSGIATVKSFTREEAEKQRFLRDVASANEIVERGVGFDGAVRGGQNLVVGAARVSALGVGGYLVAGGDVTVGTLVAFLGYVAGLFGPVKGLTGIYETYQKARASLETLQDILDAPEEVRDADHAVELDEVRGHVRFERVRFAYPHGGEVLRGIDLHVEAGETVALVGPSGSGKSTTMALLQRFWDPTRGRLLVDGHDLREVTQRSLRACIGVVHQEALLFKDSVAANIAYGAPDACPSAISEAARNANAHEFILRLADGYETIVGERGVCLSGGQRQRIAIARALLKDPPILILDEATSALDAESEALVQQAIERLAAGRTTFVIAHRLSTVMSADRIAVLRDGAIVEMGDHRELLARRGIYASLVRRQLGSPSRA